MKTRIASSANTRSKRNVRLEGLLPEQSKKTKPKGKTLKRQPMGKSDRKIREMFGLSKREKKGKRRQSTETSAGTATRAQTSARTRGGKSMASSKGRKSIPKASTPRRPSVSMSGGEGPSGAGGSRYEESATYTDEDVAEAAQESSEGDEPLSLVLSRRNSQREASGEGVRSRSGSRRPSQDATQAGAAQAAKVTDKRKSRERERSGEGAGGGPGSRRPSQDATQAGAAQAAKVTAKRKSREGERSVEGAGGGPGSRRPSQDATQAGAAQAAKVTDKRKSREGERSGEGAGGGPGSRRPSQDATQAGAAQAAKATEQARKPSEERPTSSSAAKSTTQKRKHGHANNLPKRRQQEIETNPLKTPEIRRLARRGGVKRLSKTIYNPIRNRVAEFTALLIEKALHYMHCAKRKTITPMDIVYSLKFQNRTLYGFGG